ncbi:hypothetical protein ATANTOWER_018731, partial [Ataeniobius toweri]|nr:hypothetical protein [Ataeniobius toweri]
LQQSPGRKHDLFPRTSSSQSGKHSGMPEEGVFHTVGQDALEKGHITAGPSTMKKSGTGDLTSLEGVMSILPQLGDSEEKLQQRLWLRQRILRNQQNQKIALRQEKGLLEPTSGPGGSGTPLHSWPSEDLSTIPHADPFGRPPPPYPGTVRPPAPGFTGRLTGEQMSGFTSGEAPIPRQNLRRDHCVRGQAVRFGVSQGTPVGLQDPSVRPSLEQGNLGQLRRSVPPAFTGIRSLMHPNLAGPVMPGVPQLIVPRSQPPQQHGIMPYIELRHHAAENRLRLPFPLPTPPEPQEARQMPTRDPNKSSAARPGSVKMGEAGLDQQTVELDQQHLGPGEAALPRSDGIEQHLEGEDSAVKDLEDVEVKDLVDLNLNLDPEDGKEDLDLGPNDLHLDDFLLTGKFDLIAYADPELNLEDKKDIFNEELDLGEPAEDREGGRAFRKPDGPANFPCRAKQEVNEAKKAEADTPAPLPLATSRPPGAPSVFMNKTKLEGSGAVSGPAPVVPDQEQTLSSVHRLMSQGEPSVFQHHQRPFGSTPVLQCQCPIPSGPTPQSSPTMPQIQSSHPPQPQPLNPQNQPPHPGTETQGVSSVSFLEHQVPVENQNKTRPLLLEEQPLLLQDLLDQERQEQQQQKQMQALIRQRSGSESGFSNVGCESISDPIMKAKMQALKGINRVMSQGNLGLNPMVINRFQQTPGTPGPELTPQSPHLLGQDGKLNPQLVRRTPPSFGPGLISEHQSTNQSI